MKYLMLFVFAVLAGCKPSVISEKPKEIISFLSLEYGIRDTLFLDEIFFSETYKPEFKPNDNINVIYLQETNQLILDPSSNIPGLSFIEFSNNSEQYVLPVKTNKKTEVLFAYKPEQKQKNIYVMGNFNNWNRRANAMLDPEGDGIYEAVISLDEGVYEYQFVLDHQEIFDPENPGKVDNGFGYFNSIKRVVSEQSKQAPGLFFIPTNNDYEIILALVSEQPESELKIYGLLDNHYLPEDMVKVHERHVYLDLEQLALDNNIHLIRIVATGNGQPGNIVSIWTKNGKILNNNYHIWQDAIIYSLMVDRFCNGDSSNDSPVINPDLADQANFKGGDLKGIIQILESGYFDSLGVNTLWISPINKTTNLAYREWPEPHRYFSGYHGYWPVSSDQVEPRFGSMSDFKTLVHQAHEKDIRILLDFISNHTHMEHPFYKNNPEWFGNVDLPNGEKNIRRWDEYRLTTWFDTFLPSFDYLGSAEALETMTNNAVWWLQETGIDGFRHDATKHVPYEFWRTLTRKIKLNVNPERNYPIYQIGETFGGYDLIKSYVNCGMLDAQFSFNQFFIARRVFTEEKGNLKDLAGEIEKAQKVYGYNNLMGNIMDSHDQARMMALLDGDLTLSDDAVERAWSYPAVQVDHAETFAKARVFFTYLLTVPGIPIIYYGDEFGMTGAGDPDNRRMMHFNEKLTMQEIGQLNQVKKIINVRNRHSSLRRGDYLTLYSSPDILIYTRGDARERLIITLSKSNKEQNVKLLLPRWMKSSGLQSLISGKTINIQNNELEMVLSSNTGDIWTIMSKNL